MTFSRDRVLDNRFLIANLIACAPDTPRVVGACDVFAIQDKVINDILGSVREQQAMEAAPRALDPLQQTVITLLRGYLNSPSIKRAHVREAMQRLRSPMPHSAIRDLRRAYEQFRVEQDIERVIGHIRSIEIAERDAGSSTSDTQMSLSQEDLHLVCFGLCMELRSREFLGVVEA